MGKDKLQRFAAIKTFENVLEIGHQQPLAQKGKWNELFFKKPQPIVLELGCGKGEYSVGMAEMFPNKNFIGIDIKGNRLYIGARDALQKKLENVGFLRTRVDFIEDHFGSNEVDEIWLTFSDPQPNKPRKRLTSTLFINRYRKFLKPGGLIHLKTDSSVLFDSTMEQIKLNKYELVDLRPDLYATVKEGEEEQKIFSIKTHYETLFTKRGHVIKYCCFKIN